MIPQVILLALLVSPLIGFAYADQSITVNATTPCFLNSTAGFQMLENCGANRDWLKFILLPFEWVTGGWFSVILVSVLILSTYLKYHKAIYPVIIGIVFLPTSLYLYPDNWIFPSLICMALVIGILIWKGFFKNTKEYD